MVVHEKRLRPDNWLGTLFRNSFSAFPFEF